MPCGRSRKVILFVIYLYKGMTEATVRNFRTVQKEGNREVSRDIEHYNLDMIISLGYRIIEKNARVEVKHAKTGE